MYALSLTHTNTGCYRIHEQHDSRTYLTLWSSSVSFCLFLRSASLLYHTHTHAHTQSSVFESDRFLSAQYPPPSLSPLSLISQAHTQTLKNSPPSFLSSPLLPNTPNSLPSLARARAASLLPFPPSPPTLPCEAV